MFKKRSLFALLLAFTMLLPMSTTLTVSANSDIKVKRIAGNNRYSTSISMSKAGFKESEYAVIASGENFPDALVGGVLAGYLSAPLLTTPKDTVSYDLLNELDRLGVKKIYLLGGLNTLTRNIESSLSKFEIIRLAGSNRYETAKKVEQVIRDLTKGFAYNYYVDGRNFPDALASAPFIYRATGVMILNNGKSVNSNGIAIGGVMSVPGNIKRISGQSRYETALAIARYFKVIDEVVLVDGTNFPDALSASGYAARNNIPILLTDPNSLSAAALDFIKDRGVEKVVILGGENSVSDNIIKQINNINNPQNDNNPNSSADQQKPVDPEKPNDTQKPVEPDKPVKPDEPEKPVKPVEPEKPVKPVEDDKMDSNGLGLNRKTAKEMANIVNQIRKDKGLYPLTWDENLANAAEIRAKELSTLFSHTRPDGRYCFSVSENAFAENIAKNYNHSAQSTIDRWMNSEGHRANILSQRDDINAIGIGCWIDEDGFMYSVQLFGISEK